MRPNKNQATSKNTTSDGYAYLTKRTLISSAKSAGKAAAEKAMDLMGYVVVAENGWIVKKYRDGNVVRISQVRK